MVKWNRIAFTDVNALTELPGTMHMNKWAFAPFAKIF